MVLYIGSHSVESQMMSRSAFESWTSWTLWAMGMGRLLDHEGGTLSSWLTPHPCQAYTRWCSHTSACAEAPTEAWGSHMDRLMLDHFHWIVVILYYDMPALEVGVEFLQTEAY